jgi:hypothetical protein
VSYTIRTRPHCQYGVFIRYKEVDEAYLDDALPVGPLRLLLLLGHLAVRVVKGEEVETTPPKPDERKPPSAMRGQRSGGRRDPGINGDREGTRRRTNVKSSAS